MLSEGSIRVDVQKNGLEEASRLEYLLTNGLGGYCSSTVAALNTRKYHGLLVASVDGLKRHVVVESLIDELVLGMNKHSLSVAEYEDTLDSRGFKHLRLFSRHPYHVVFEYVLEDVCLTKSLFLHEKANVLDVVYEIENNSGERLRHNVKPVLNHRLIHEIDPWGRDFRLMDCSDTLLELSCRNNTILVSSSGFSVKPAGVWYRRIKYALEDMRGEACVEDAYCPCVLELDAGESRKSRAAIRIVYAGNRGQAYHGLGLSRFEAGISAVTDPLGWLQLSARQFIVDVEGKKTLIAGYHWFEDWGRDSMISLPGLLLADSKIAEAELVFDRYLSAVSDGRIPTKFTLDGPKYYDFDASLWLIDRLKEYMKYASIERSLEYVRPRWEKIKSVAKSYSSLLRNGLVRHSCGTWMDTLARDDAIEVQALWYNALHVVEGISLLLGDGVDYSGYKRDFESSFMDRFWNGNYLNDCVDDASLRPNQVIALSLDNTVVPKKDAIEAIKVVDEQLLTPYGLRTLERGDPRYRPRYVGGVDERARAYHNGPVWPWLSGPYCRALARYGGRKGKKHAAKVLSPLFERVFDGCLGSVSEVYDAERPYLPRGAVSQAWSVAELLRAYLEDASYRKH